MPYCEEKFEEGARSSLKLLISQREKWRVKTKAVPVSEKEGTDFRDISEGEEIDLVSAPIE